jgi:hypothetical protein
MYRMEDMEQSTNYSANPRATPPTAKEKNVVQRAVTALLDALAPERATTRADRAPVPIEPHRTPSGCVLQAATSAVSVSWFPDAASEAALGELQVVVWRGVVSRRGAAPRREAAVVTQELLFRPIEHPTDACVWQATDGTSYDVEGLAAYCLALLKEQMLADDPTGSAVSTTARRRD